MVFKQSTKNENIMNIFSSILKYLCSFNWENEDVSLSSSMMLFSNFGLPIFLRNFKNLNRNSY